MCRPWNSGLRDCKCKALGLLAAPGTPVRRNHATIATYRPRFKNSWLQSQTVCYPKPFYWICMQSRSMWVLPSKFSKITLSSSWNLEIGFVGMKGRIWERVSRSENGMNTNDEWNSAMFMNQFEARWSILINRSTHKNATSFSDHNTGICSPRFRRKDSRTSTAQNFVWIDPNVRFDCGGFYLTTCRQGIDRFSAGNATGISRKSLGPGLRGVGPSAAKGLKGFIETR